jgi:hypothetical protein
MTLVHWYRFEVEQHCSLFIVILRRMKAVTSYKCQLSFLAIQRSKRQLIG